MDVKIISTLFGTLIIGVFVFIAYKATKGANSLKNALENYSSTKGLSRYSDNSQLEQHLQNFQISQGGNGIHRVTSAYNLSDGILATYDKKTTSLEGGVWHNFYLVTIFENLVEGDYQNCMQKAQNPNNYKIEFNNQILIIYFEFSKELSTTAIDTFVNSAERLKNNILSYAAAQ